MKNTCCFCTNAVECNHRKTLGKVVEADFIWDHYNREKEIKKGPGSIPNRAKYRLEITAKEQGGVETKYQR